VRFGPAHFSTEVHDSLVPDSRISLVEPIGGTRGSALERNLFGLRAEGSPSDDPPDVCVHRRDGFAVTDGGNGRGGVGTNARESPKEGGILRDDALVSALNLPRRFVQGNGATVVPKAGPGPQDRAPGRPGQVAGGWKELEKSRIRGGYPRNLGLLEHDLADQDPVRVGRTQPPRIGPPPRPVPGEEGRAGRGRRA
jgi:hypothetical protein